MQHPVTAKPRNTSFHCHCANKRLSLSEFRQSCLNCREIMFFLGNPSLEEILRGIEENFDDRNRRQFFFKTGVFSKAPCLLLPLRYNRGGYDHPADSQSTEHLLPVAGSTLPCVLSVFCELQQLMQEEASLRQEIFKCSLSPQQKRKKLKKKI